MKLSVIFPVFNQFPLATAAIDLAINKLSEDEDSLLKCGCVEFIILDNGSDQPFQYSLPLLYDNEGNLRKEVSYRVVRSEKNVGVYPTFWWGLKEATGNVLAFFHSDLMIAEKGWDKRVMEAFGEPQYPGGSGAGFHPPVVGMVGFVGSNEIDAAGGRGLGTASNFIGGTYTISAPVNTNLSFPPLLSWTGSPAEVHGKRLLGSEPAAVEDGCAMIFSRSCLEAIPQRMDFPPHHFYDRLLSCEVRERGFSILTLGIACDHISGQTVNQEQGYQDMAREWCEAHGLSLGAHHNWDSVVYDSAGRQWLTEYKDQKGLVPCKV